MSLRRTRVRPRRVVIHNLGVRVAHQNAVLRCCFRSLSGLGGSRSLLPGGISFGEALLAGLGLPVIVSDAAAVFDDAASKLSEHGAGSNNGNLSRPIRERQDFLLDKVVLFGLARDYLVQRPVLVKQEVRIPVSQHACALGGQHEKFVSAVRDQECAASILTVAKKRTVGHHLLLAEFVGLARDILIARRIELISGVVSHRGQSLESRLCRRRLGWQLRRGGRVSWGSLSRHRRILRLRRLRRRDGLGHRSARRLPGAFRDATCRSGLHWS